MNKNKPTNKGHIPCYAWLIILTGKTMTHRKERGGRKRRQEHVM